MNLKALIEKKNAILDQMDKLLSQAEDETRALSDEETGSFKGLEKEVRDLDETIAAAERREALERMEAGETTPAEEKRALDDKEHFLSYLRGETRALGVADNSAGSIIPETIANKIIETVKEICPIYNLVTVYNVGGDLILPVYDDKSSSVGAAYSEDMAELTEGTGKFTTVKLENFIIGSLAKVSRSLMNRTDFDVLTFVIQKVSQAIAEFLEKELLVGTAGKMEGVCSAPQSVTAASATAVTTDELIDLQDMIPDRYQNGACWIMNKATRRAIRKLKDNEGNYILNRDLTAPFGYSLLGKAIYISDNMPVMAAGKTAIVYGDMTGLSLKLAQSMQIQVLLEKYATQHAVGVVGYAEADSKITEPQKLAVLKMKAGA